MDVIKIRYKITNCYFVDTGVELLAFDAGWPNTYREYKDCLEGLHTNGHGEQSISLFLDTGDAFIGDLTPEFNMVGDDDWRSKNSWDLLRSKGAKYIKPAHANEYVLT